MKIRYIIFYLCTLVLCTTSCDDFLDITPDGQVKRDQLLETPEGIEDALYGVYSQLRSTALYGQELHFSAIEIMAHNMYCNNNTAIEALGRFEYTHSAVQDLFEGIWTEMYKNISNVNSILNSSLIGGADVDSYPYNIYKGEALGLRAFMHFDLMRLFAEQITVNPNAEGIPYATEFSLNTPQFETLAKNYEHVLNDLLEAEKFLANENEYTNTSNFMRDRQIHFNLYAVKATLARVYLTMGNKEKALEYAKAVIDESGYTLKEKIEVKYDLAGVLSVKETVFGVYFAGFYANVSPKLQQMIDRTSLYPRDDIKNLYENDVPGLDYRVDAYFTSVVSGNESRERLSKLTERYELQNMVSSRPSKLILGINMIRIPEMYYIAAECLLDDNYDDAVWYFDEVLKHRGIDPLSTRIENNLLTQKEINDERLKEFIGEGQTFFNMKRQNLDILSFDGLTTYKAGKGTYVVPIPDIEIENRN